MDIQVISVIVTIALAFLGYLITHQQELSISKRKERLDLIDRRLNEFYGPLFVSSRSSQIALQSFFDNRKLKMKALSHDTNGEGQDFKYDDAKEWRLWVENVFMPLNAVSEKVILEKAYLIRENEMPACLLEFVAHISSYKAVIKKWKQEDFSDEFALIKFPTELNTYLLKSYQELKAEQLELIGKLQPNKRLA